MHCRLTYLIARRILTTLRQPLLIEWSKTHPSTYACSNRLYQVAGKVKEVTGKATGNPNLQDRGTAEKAGGKVEKKVGDIKKVFGK